MRDASAPPEVGEWSDGVSGAATRVTLEVYPRLSRLHVDRDLNVVKGAKGAPEVTYPDVHFALDDFESALAAAPALRRPGHRFSVVLQVRFLGAVFHHC